MFKVTVDVNTLIAVMSVWKERHLGKSNSVKVLSNLCNTEGGSGNKTTQLSEHVTQIGVSPETWRSTPQLSLYTSPLTLHRWPHLCLWEGVTQIWVSCDERGLRSRYPHTETDGPSWAKTADAHRNPEMSSVVSSEARCWSWTSDLSH